MKIGFIDHHLNNYHSTTFHRLLMGGVGAGEVEIIGAYESNREGDDWCAEHNVTRISSPEEIIEKSDAIIVLAPNNVEAHLELARPALALGKPTFIDKNLSATVADAREIVRLASEQGTPIMSSSSLRFSTELEEMLPRVNGEVQSLFSRGFGKWRGYSVHSIAPALRVLDRPIKRIIDTGHDGARVVTLDCGDIRALIEVRESENQYEATPWQVGVLAGGKYEVATIAKFDEFYANLMHQVLRFFRAGESPLSADEMIQEVIVETAADESLARGGEWVTV